MGRKPTLYRCVRLAARSARHYQLEVADVVRLGSAFRHIAHARAILKEQCGQPLLSQRIVPRKVMVQPREAQLGMPVARYVAPERDRDTGREVSGRRPPQVVLADLPQAANERACAHEVLAGVETQQFRNIRNRPITAEYPAVIGRLRMLRNCCVSTPARTSCAQARSLAACGRSARTTCGGRRPDTSLPVSRSRSGAT